MFGFWGETLAEGAICDDAEESGEGAAEPVAEVDSWVDDCRSGSTEAVAEGDVFGTGIATASPVVALELGVRERFPLTVGCRVTFEEVVA